MTEEDLPEVHVSTRLVTRLVVGLLAFWNLAAGLVLLAVPTRSTGALGAGVSDENGQRLVGAHLLVLVPAYIILVIWPERYRVFFWLPLAAQLAVVCVVGYGILSGSTAFSDGILAVAVGIIFVVLLSFLWITEQRTVARMKMDDDEDATSAMSR